MHSEPPVEASIYVRVEDEHGQWGIAVLGEDGAIAVHTGEVEPQGTFRATLAEAAVAAFAAVLGAAAGRPYVILDVAPGRLRAAIDGLVDRVTGVVLSEPSWAAPAHRAAVFEAVMAMPGKRAKARKGPAPVSMVLTTDASVHSFGMVAGLGFVVAAKDGRVMSAGQKAVQVPGRGDVLSGELLAILWGLRFMAGKHPVPDRGLGSVAVQTDSKGALATLEAVRAGRSTAGGGKEHARAAGQILAFTESWPVRFCWVRGHSGHPANEAADRLAVLARRGEESNIPHATRKKMFEKLRGSIIEKSAA